MTKNQKEILKKLGYKETDEDGAILEHSEYGFWDSLPRPHLDFVWKGDTFEYILTNYTAWVERCAKKRISQQIINSMYQK